MFTLRIFPFRDMGVAITSSLIPFSVVREYLTVAFFVAASRAAWSMTAALESTTGAETLFLSVVLPIHPPAAAPAAAPMMAPLQGWLESIKAPRIPPDTAPIPPPVLVFGDRPSQVAQPPNNTHATAITINPFIYPSFVNNLIPYSILVFRFSSVTRYKRFVLPS